MGRITVLALTHHTGIRLVEVGLVFFLLAGAWMASAQVSRWKPNALRVIAGVALVLGAVLVLIAVHWAHFG
jgi:uncharacterized protein YjeT (DUF2065 family)